MVKMLIALFLYLRAKDAFNLIKNAVIIDKKEYYKAKIK